MLCILSQCDGSQQAGSWAAAIFCHFIVFTKTTDLIKETKAHVIVRLFRFFLLLLFLLLLLGCREKEVRDG